ncbi:hypothetical protein V491_00250 [Pseudogymnoascus sp. VKM F-3775]|nr:hypothetical protein V491_00250 [Pseudogymnoascus sp. VKM F-3775]
MVKRKSIKAQELNLRISEAVQGIKSGKFKSAYQAAKALGLRANTVHKCANGGLTHVEAHQKQQLLSKNQEQTLLKWIKGLTRKSGQTSVGSSKPSGLADPIKSTGAAADQTDPAVLTN